jgi:hypothetical protein
MIRGKRMQKNYRWTFAHDVIDNFRIAAFDALHASDLITDGRGVSQMEALFAPSFEFQI